MLSILVRHDWDPAPKHCQHLWCLHFVKQDCGMTRQEKDWECCCTSGLGQHGHVCLGRQPKTVQLCLLPKGGSRLLLYFRIVAQLLRTAVAYYLLASTSDMIFILINLKTSYEKWKFSPASKGCRETGRTWCWCHRGDKGLWENWFPIWHFLSGEA